MLTPAPAVSEPREPEWGMRSVSPVSQSAGGRQHASIKHQTEHIEDFIYKIEIFARVIAKVSKKNRVPTYLLQNKH